MAAARPTLTNADVEAEARALLRDQIARSAWFRDMPDGERLEAIEQEVDRWWPFKVDDAVHRLLDRVGPQPQPRPVSGTGSASSGAGSLP